MYPSLEKLRQLKTDSTYRRFPVCRELYADRYTPVEMMRILRKAAIVIYWKVRARRNSGEDIPS